MRMWNVDPKFLCSKHLRGEHYEMHMFIGSIKKGTSIRGYLDKGFVEVHNIIKRHNILAEEMIKRGMNHKSPLEYDGLWEEGFVDIVKSHGDLLVRCKDCQKLYFDSLVEGILTTFYAPIMFQPFIKSEMWPSSDELQTKPIFYDTTKE